MDGDGGTDDSDEMTADYFVIERREKPFRYDSQWKVGQLIRQLTVRDWAVGYYNYPFRAARNEFDESPDIVLLHADIGLVVITCRGYDIDAIGQVTPEDWEVDDRYDRPIPEVQEQLAHVQSQLTGVSDLIDFRDHGAVLGVVALPELSQGDWEDAGYPDFPVTMLFADDLTSNSLKQVLVDEAGEVTISEELYKKARKRMNQGDILSADRDPIRTERLEHTRSALYREAARGFEMHEQDRIQEQIGLHIPPGPQQIRGIAGSGKTTIMAKKAAVMHWQREEWDIAFTFNTRSLYQTIRENVTQFYRDFSNGQDPGDNLVILHGWGKNPSYTKENEQARGLYRDIAVATGIKPYRINDPTSSSFPSLNAHCADLVTREDIPELYDAILIDEAQDFGPAFYRMCYDALREPKRLIWAYDEAQTLNNLSAPSPKIIFHEDDADHREVDLSGFYPGSVRKSFVMRQSYRTPRDVLMAAHALGMGLYRSVGVVHTLTREQDWDAIGYSVDEGSFSRPGTEIRISRSRELSPHPLQSLVEPDELFSYSFHSDVSKEAEEIAQRVLRDITEENLDPTQIMVVCIGPKDWTNSPSVDLAGNVRAGRIADSINTLAADEIDNDSLATIAVSGSRDEFWKEGHVTVAGSDRAKGNEAASVYVAGAEQISQDNWQDAHSTHGLVWRDDYVQVRNEVFVGLTRSEGWCHISGVGDDTHEFLREIVEVADVISDPDPTIVFQAPNPSEMTGEILIDETVPMRNVQQAELEESIR